MGSYKMITTSWFPDLIECSDFSKYKEYEDMIYDIY